MTDATQTVPGVDLDAVARWMDGEGLPGVRSRTCGARRRDPERDASASAAAARSSCCAAAPLHLRPKSNEPCAARCACSGRWRRPTCRARGLDRRVPRRDGARRRGLLPDGAGRRLQRERRAAPSCTPPTRLCAGRWPVEAVDALATLAAVDHDRRRARRLRPARGLPRAPGRRAGCRSSSPTAARRLPRPGHPRPRRGAAWLEANRPGRRGRPASSTATTTSPT